MQKVRIWTTPTCPWCTVAKEFLKQNKIMFEEIDVQATPAAAAELVKKSGQFSVPVLEIGGQIIVGFDKAAIKRALRRLAKVSPRARAR